jgi:Na+/proline symporter
MARATQDLARMQPPRLGTLVFETAEPAPDAGYRVPTDTWLVLLEGRNEDPRLFRTNQTAVILAGETVSARIAAVEIITPEERQRILQGFPGGLPPLPASLEPRVVELNAYAFGAATTGVYTSAPGPSPTEENGFLPFGLAVSFFVFWALSGTGQPGNMVRLMAFDNTATLKKAIASLSVYFSLIYFPLVVIFCCARILAPGLDQTPDRIMPVMAFTLTDNAGLPWLAGLIIAAPFAAAMSTVDSFMLMISSSVVRDVYQREINPGAGERTIRAFSYACTVLVGILATLGAVNPPQFLQYVIVFNGGALSSAFLAPVGLGLYWPRFTKQGAIASMLGGFGTYGALYLAGFLQYGGTAPVRLFGFDPLILGFLVSLLAALAFTYGSPPPDARLVQRFFLEERPVNRR